jgi:hypothetical protein
MLHCILTEGKKKDEHYGRILHFTKSDRRVTYIRLPEDVFTDENEEKANPPDAQDADGGANPAKKRKTNEQQAAAAAAAAAASGATEKKPQIKTVQIKRLDLTALMDQEVCRHSLLAHLSALTRPLCRWRGTQTLAAKYTQYADFMRGAVAEVLEIQVRRAACAPLRLTHCLGRCGSPRMPRPASATPSRAAMRSV